MSRSEEELLARYLEGEISPEEEAELLALLRRDPRAADQLESFPRLDEGLRQAIVPEASGDALVRAVAERLAKRGGTGVFARQVVEQIAAAETSGRKKTRWIRILRPRDRKTGSWTLPLIAAASLFAILLVAAVVGQGKARPVRAEPRDTAVVPAPPTEPDVPAPPRRNPVDLRMEVAALEQERRAIEEKREQALKEAEDARRGELLRQAEAELARVAARYREKVDQLKQAEQPVVKAPAPSSTVPSPSLPPAARIEKAEGEVFLVSREGSVPVRVPHDLSAGWEIRVPGAAGQASVALSDGTRLDLAGRTSVRDEKPARGAKGKRIFVAQGTLNAQVQPQPAGQPLVFATPNAEATVLGTRLRLDVNAASTVLEVTEGKVRLTRLEDGRTVDVAAGQYAEATRGVALEARSLQSIDEIVLAPQQGRILSPVKQAIPDWRPVADGRAFRQTAFDAPRVRNGLDGEGMALFKMKSLDYVEYTFRADAEKDYTVWVRGCRNRKGDPAPNEWFRFDLLAVEVLEAQSSSTPNLDGRAHQFNGFGQKEGFWWISGNADPSDPQMTGLPADRPLRVRYARRGLQILRVYPIETPMRFDVVWLSATQKQRPPEGQIGAQKK